jgi:hypothetical protein
MGELIRQTGADAPEAPWMPDERLVLRLDRALLRLPSPLVRFQARAAGSRRSVKDRETVERRGEGGRKVQIWRT